MTKMYLPVVGSTAATTAFATAEVRLTSDHDVVLDGNGKITLGNGTYAHPAPNALSLQHVLDCPGSTEACRASCYVHELKRGNPSVYADYIRNSGAIRDLMERSESLRFLAAARLGNWIRANCPDGFRWHVSGDVFSPAYARWIRDVSVWAGVRTWIYTRSLWAVPTLLEASTLSVFVSADRDNYRVAIPTARACGARVALLLHAVPGRGEEGAVAKDMLECADGTDIIFPDYEIRPRAHGAGPKESPLWAELPPVARRGLCPVDSFGASERIRCGPCSKCFYRGDGSAEAQH